jgi:hypothetical protein
MAAPPPAAAPSEGQPQLVTTPPSGQQLFRHLNLTEKEEWEECKHWVTVGVSFIVHPDHSKYEERKLVYDEYMNKLYQRYFELKTKYSVNGLSREEQEQTERLKEESKRLKNKFSV